MTPRFKVLSAERSVHKIGLSRRKRLLEIHASATLRRCIICAAKGNSSEEEFETSERIDIDPAIMMGKPVIRGTRITVELLEDYPHLTTEDIRAAVAYGAASVAHEEVVLLPNEPRARKS